MYIRRTTIKSRRTGKPYYTYRLVESSRTAKGVRQRTVLNLGSHFEVPRQQWAALAQRIEALVHGQLDLLPDGLDLQWDVMAQQYAARIIREHGDRSRESSESPTDVPDYQRVDLCSLELIRPRSVGVEHVALGALQQLGLDTKLEALGFNGREVPAAIGQIIARMVKPASELATHQWLQQHSGLGELLGHDFETLSLTRLYRVADQLLEHQQAIEAYLYHQERDLFALQETITLYDLTNTFFEGAARDNRQAKRGHSKEKRSDCPLVTLALPSIDEFEIAVSPSESTLPSMRERSIETEPPDSTFTFPSIRMRSRVQEAPDFTSTSSSIDSWLRTPSHSISSSRAFMMRVRARMQPGIFGIVFESGLVARARVAAVASSSGSRLRCSRWVRASAASPCAPSVSTGNRVRPWRASAPLSRIR